MLTLEELPAVPGVTHREVQAGGVRLHVAEAGSGPPIVLLHGWPQHWWSWRRVIPALAERRRVIVPDLRGWGWSEAPPGAYLKRTFATDVLALLDALGLERVQLIGHDWGGWTSFLLALRAPERIERMVALDIPPPWPARPQRSQLKLPAFLSYQVTVGMPVLGPRTMTSSNRFIRAIIRAGSGPRMRWAEDELDCYAEVLREPARARASSACYRSFLTRELPASLLSGPRAGALEVPTRLVMGGASFLQRTLAPQPSRNLEIATIPGAGHFLPEEAPEEVLRLATEHLDG